ncbi:MAG: hypothetical protein ACODAQ_03040 [Phycisphaeraceae bacterium]
MKRRDLSRFAAEKGPNMQLRTHLHRARRLLARFHSDERGAEGLEKLLILAAIIIPLLGVLIFFRDAISEWVFGKWGEIQDEADSSPIP